MSSFFSGSVFFQELEIFFKVLCQFVASLIFFIEKRLTSWIIWIDFCEVLFFFLQNRHGSTFVCI